MQMQAENSDPAGDARPIQNRESGNRTDISQVPGTRISRMDSRL